MSDVLAALRAKGASVEALAQQCGVSERTAAAWAAGRRRPAEAHAATIAALVGADVARALYGVRGPGRGRLPGGPGLARAVRATVALLRARGAHETAEAVQRECC